MKTLFARTAPLVGALIAALGLALAAAGAAAQTRPAPGLWEHRTTMKSGSGEMEAAMAQMREQMAKMSPQQRAQMEQMMGQRGISMPGAGGAPDGGMAMKVCLTAEQIARDELPPPDSKCRQTGRERSGNTYRFKFECSGEHRASGEGEYTFSSDKAYTGRIVTTAQRQGRSERMEMQTDAKWLGADCGAIRPRGAAGAAAPGAPVTPGAPGAPAPAPRAPTK